MSEVHENEHETVGRGVGVGECRFVRRYSFPSALDRTEVDLFSLARFQSSLTIESTMSSSSKYKQDLEAMCRSTPAIAG